MKLSPEEFPTFWIDHPSFEEMSRALKGRSEKLSFFCPGLWGKTDGPSASSVSGDKITP